jgi:hypothetical protein
MGTNPAQQAGRVTHGVISLVASVALAVLMVQHSAARKAAERDARAAGDYVASNAAKI